MIDLLRRGWPEYVGLSSLTFSEVRLESPTYVLVGPMAVELVSSKRHADG
jgi:hypothetical protein